MPAALSATRVAGLAVTIACWVWASSLSLDRTAGIVFVWLLPLLQFPISKLGRKALDARSGAAHVAGITVVVHYAMMIVLGGALFPAFRHILRDPTPDVPVLREGLLALVILTGAAAGFTVVNLAVHGLGAPFAARLSTRLATDWWYARTRNPMGLCTLAWFLCLAAWHQSPWFVVFLAVSIVPGWVYFVKIYEERELEIRFGASYIAYRARTPFLWPRLSGRAAPKARAHTA